MEKHNGIKQVCKNFMYKNCQREDCKFIHDNTICFYYWKHGSDYVKYAEQMIQKNIRVNNEFYVCPVFNQAIQNNKKIRVKNINCMWGLGTPEDLRHYLEHHKS